MTIERESKRYYTDSVRELAHEIVQTSSGILTINDEALKGDLIIKLQEFKAQPKKVQDHFANESLSPENELGLNLFLNVVNFCYKDPYTKKDYTYIDKKGKRFSRSTGLKTAMDESGVNWGDTKEVARLTPEKWAEIIQLNNNEEFYLGAERGKRIAGFATTLYISGFGSVTDLLTFVNYDTEILLPSFKRTGFFADEFEKRSQLSVNMMNGVLKRRFATEFKGMDTLTVMSDYRLPQLMYNFGIIELSGSLEEKLLKEEIIETGSPAEVALRAATIVIGGEVSKIMNIPEGEVDSLLWTTAFDFARNGKFLIPHMLVPTDKY